MWPVQIKSQLRASYITDTWYILAIIIIFSIIRCCISHFCMENGTILRISVMPLKGYSWWPRGEVRSLVAVAKSRRNQRAQQELMVRVSKGWSTSKENGRGKGRSHMVTVHDNVCRTHSSLHSFPQQILMEHQQHAKCCASLYGWGIT